MTGRRPSYCGYSDARDVSSWPLDFPESPCPRISSKTERWPVIITDNCFSSHHKRAHRHAGPKVSNQPALRAILVATMRVSEVPKSNF